MLVLTISKDYMLTEEEIDPVDLAVEEADTVYLTDKETDAVNLVLKEADTVID